MTIEPLYQAYGSNLLYREVSVGGEAEAQSYYYLYNAHGDVTSLIDAEGNIAATYDYDAFGNIINKTGEADNSIRYAGYQYDEDSGLYYLNARYYDSVTARFITEDTYYGQMDDPLSLNLYSYCANNPIKYIDPTGHYIKGDEYLTDSAQLAISRLTDLYYSTDDPEEKKRISQECNEIRNNPDNKMKTKNNSAIVKAYEAEKNKDGTVSREDWLRISKTLNDKSTQSAINAINSTAPDWITNSVVESISGGLDDKKQNAKKEVKKDDKKKSDKVIDADTLVSDNVVYYSQSDSRWANIMYSSVGDKDQTIASSGCGVTAMAMVITSLSDYTVTPIDMAKFSVNNGYRTKSNGTDWGFFKAAGQKYNLEVVQTNNYNDVINALNNGNCMVIASMDEGHFTKNGHFIVIAGVSEINGKEMLYCIRSQ